MPSSACLQGGGSGTRSRCSRDTREDVCTGRDFCDENDPYLAHLHRLHALQASRVSTSSIDGVRIAPACAAAQSTTTPSPPTHPLHGDTALETNRHLRSAPSYAHVPVTPTDEGRSWLRSVSGYGAAAARRHTSDGEHFRPVTSTPSTDYDSRHGTTSEEYCGGADGRMCDIFRGRHGSGVVCGILGGPLPFRRAHSSPDMQLEPL